MEAVDKSLFDAFPNMAMSPADLLKLEAMRDIGMAQKAYTRAVTEITASQ
jgi:spermidine/putrescine transport system substrate-binding protein